MTGTSASNRQTLIDGEMIKIFFFRSNYCDVLYTYIYTLKALLFMIIFFFYPSSILHFFSISKWEALEHKAFEVARFVLSIQWCFNCIEFRRLYVYSCNSRIQREIIAFCLNRFEDINVSFLSLCFPCNTHDNH